ncbi:MAG: hypothetical protein GF333_01195 [Candidatus Omnitrophica bacterium]|nr:hypothetical protein [Candidatus Omnitrophota bacterium]
MKNARSRYLILWILSLLAAGAAGAAMVFQFVPEEHLCPGQRAGSSAGEVLLPEEMKPRIDYGQFAGPFEQHFRELDSVYTRLDNFLKGRWNDEGISEKEKYYLLSLRDRLQMISVLMNYMWFDEYLLQQKEYYLNPRSLKIVMDSTYAHKLKIISELVDTQLETLGAARDDISEAEVLRVMQAARQVLEKTQRFLREVSQKYGIES